MPSPRRSVDEKDTGIDLGRRVVLHRNRTLTFDGELSSSCSNATASHDCWIWEDLEMTSEEARARRKRRKSYSQPSVLERLNVRSQKLFESLTTDVAIEPVDLSSKEALLEALQQGQVRRAQRS